MKAFRRFLVKSLSVALALGALSFGASRTRAELEVSADVRIHAVTEFQAPLTPHGAWIGVGKYGRCWRPAGVAVEWRPYCNGHWVWTDCGWAPLPPRGVVLAPAAFVFVEERRFHERVRPSTVIVNNKAIIKQTTVINNVRRETRTFAGSGPQKVVINEGPTVAAIQRATGKTFSPTPIRDAVRQTPVPQAAMRNAAPERKGELSPSPEPGTKPNAPETKLLPDERQPAGKDVVIPRPGGSPSGQPGRPSGLPDGKGQGKGRGKS